MTQILDRIGSLDSPAARLLDRLSSRLLPSITASGACYYCCKPPACGGTRAYRCFCCMGRVSNCYCSSAC